LNNTTPAVLSKSELSDIEQALISRAESACETAHAPYSKFVVGAALLLENNEIVIGSNQENAAYPSGLCAERVAFFTAATNFNGYKIKKVVITAKRGEELEYIGVSPCGSCRQVMLEYEEKQAHNIEIIFETNEGWIRLPNVAILLPYGFDRKSLEKN